MTIDAITLYRYTLPLTTPLSLGGDHVSERYGLLVHVVLDSGDEGWGDVAPLPGFSTETIEEAAGHARRLRSRWGGQSLEGTSAQEMLRGLPAIEDPPASVRFGGEGAVLEALAASEGISSAQFLGAGRSTLALNALVRAGAPAALEDRGRQLRKKGYRAVKLKVGRAHVSSDVARVRALRRGLGEQVELRLDANRAWSFDEARTFLGELHGVDLSYIEEPLSDPTRIPELVNATNVPVALDETTRERSPDVLEDWPVSAIVLKPTLLGGLQEVWDWGRAARRHGGRAVISASYESGVGTRLLAALAATLSDAPAGLSPYTRLAADVLVPRLSMDRPTVDLSSIARSTVAPARLRRLD